MIFVLIGHRGCGKTSILKGLQSCNKKDLFFDLDEQIEMKYKIKINSFLNSKTEKKFRKLEIQTFKTIIKKKTNKNIFIALGAGFRIKEIKEDVYKIWIQRETDCDGRIFFNRPLFKDKNPYKDSLKLFKKREAIFKKESDETFVLKEGFEQIGPIEKAFFFEKKIDLGGILVLEKTNLKNLKTFYQKRKNWNILFELRNDLFTNTEIKKLLKIIPKEKIIYSIRKKSFELKDQFLKIDCDLKFFKKNLKCDIISSHAGFESLKKLEKFKKTHHLKFSPQIKSFKELLKAYLWWKKDTLNRSFLPRSRDSRWMWFRILTRRHMKLAFFKEKIDDSDKPYLTSWNVKKYKMHFGSIIGEPVKHSLSPFFHENFFQKRKMYFLKIKISKKELKEALFVLKKIGLKAAAITSPLKEEIAQIIPSQLNIANTLITRRKKDLLFNTDKLYLEHLNKKTKGQKIIFWGGSALRKLSFSIFKQASFFSVRKQACVYGSHEKKADLLFWALGRKNFKTSFFPSQKIKVKRVIDFNYTEDSPGRSYALKKKLPYEDGKNFFFYQAKKQKEVFKKYL